MNQLFPISILKINEILNGEIIGNPDLLIYQFNRIDQANIGELTFFSYKNYQDNFNNSQATCIIIKDENDSLPKDNQTFIKVKNPYNSFLELVFHFNDIIENSKKSNTININSFIAKTAQIGSNVNLGFSSSIEEFAIISDNVIIYNNCNISENVRIGKNTIIYSNVSIYPNCIIGENCIVHSGAVIGSDGFGYIENKEDGSFTKIPHIGNVIIEDFVEIGANTTIDRSIVGSTIIKKGTKIDNLVQIGHNCIIEENTGIAAQAGIAGTVNIGKRVRLGGQVGLAGHLNIVDDVTVIAQSGVSKSIELKGTYFGSPIKEAGRAFRIEAVLRNLPELSKEVDLLKKMVKN